MSKTDDKIAALEAEVAKLKAAQPTPYPDAAAVAAHRDRMHQMAEARASAFNPFSRADLEAMRAACPDDTMRGLVRDSHAPQAPSIEEFTIHADQRLSVSACSLLRSNEKKSLVASLIAMP